VKLHEERIADLNKKVIQAWNQFQPNWKAELAAKKQARADAKAKAEPKSQAKPKPKSKKAVVPKRNASTSKTSKKS
jgi:hypothetical protein